MSLQVPHCASQPILTANNNQVGQTFLRVAGGKERDKNRLVGGWEKENKAGNWERLWRLSGKRREIVDKVKREPLTSSFRTPLVIPNSHQGKIQRSEP